MYRHCHCLTYSYIVGSRTEKVHWSLVNNNYTSGYCKLQHFRTSPNCDNLLSLSIWGLMRNVANWNCFWLCRPMAFVSFSWFIDVKQHCVLATNPWLPGHLVGLSICNVFFLLCSSSNSIVKVSIQSMNDIT